MTALTFKETENINKSSKQQLNSQEEKMEKEIRISATTGIMQAKNNESNIDNTIKEEEKMAGHSHGATANNGDANQVNYETMETSSVTGDNAIAFLTHHVTKVKEDSQSLTGTHLEARTAFAKSLLNIGLRIKKIHEVFKNHKGVLVENNWREYFNNNFPAKFYRSAEDYKRLASVSGIQSYPVLGKDRLLTIVKIFKADLEGDNPKTMSQLFAEKGVNCDDFEDDAKVEKFINAVDVMLIVEKFALDSDCASKVKTIIEKHLHYSKLCRKLNKVVKNNGDVNEYLDAVTSNNSGRMETLEGRGPDGTNNPDPGDGAGGGDETPNPPTPEQVVEEVKTYISEKKGLLQPAANQENSQYAAIVSLMEQLEAEINRLNAPEAVVQSNAAVAAAA